MNLFKHRKWGRIIYTSIVISMILLISEIIPGISEQISKWMNYSSIQQEISQVANSSSRIDQLKKENRYLRESVTKFLNHKKENGNISDVILYLNDASIIVGTKITQIQPGKTYVKNDLEVLNVNISMKSGYENIFNFLRKLESGEKIIIINAINITQDKNSSVELLLEANLDFYTNS